MKLDQDCKFARRHNADGTVDSICLKCYRTAATAEGESQLPTLEKPARVYFRQQVCAC